MSVIISKGVHILPGESITEDVREAFMANNTEDIDDMAQKESLTLANQADELERMSEWAHRLVKKIGLSEKAFFTLNLILEELVTNIMKYAYGPGADQTIFIRASWDDERLTISIEDDGPAFNPLKAPPPDFDLGLEKMKVGGLGIHMVKKLASSLRYKRQNEKNTITLSLGFQHDIS
jgi:anti-sigma regulatory factor (Ser/Thr protein kinase)